MTGRVTCTGARIAPIVYCPECGVKMNEVLYCGARAWFCPEASNEQVTEMRDFRKRRVMMVGARHTHALPWRVGPDGYLVAGNSRHRNAVRARMLVHYQEDGKEA